MKKTEIPSWTRLATGMAVAALILAAPALADYRLEKTMELAPGGVFELKAHTGRVSVHGTDRADVRIIITADRDDIEDRFDLTFEEVSGRAEVRLRKRGTWSRSWWDRTGDLHFDVEVPRQTNLEVDTSGGSISARNIDGTANVDTSGGKIELDNIVGNVRADTSGGSISASNLGSDAMLDTSGGSISVEGVAGNLSADTSGGSIQIRGAAGRVEAGTSGGSVTAHFEAGNGAGGSLSSSGGRVTAYVDPAVALDIEASSSGAGVTVDLPIAVRGKISRDSIRGTLNGGGPLLSLQTSGGGVRLKEL
jgi:hypothetical protein